MIYTMTLCVCVCVCVQDIGDGWWEGELANGESGLFPETYVEVCS